MAFLTEIDSRAAIKGSRDPLGLVPVWSRFGRTVVGNLTTVTTSVRGFTTALLGFHCVAEIRRRRPDASALEAFLRFEQLAGYSRVNAGDTAEIRGVDRVKKRLSEGSKLVISGNPTEQILADQKIYGLWGLYSAAMRSSGLLHKEDNDLTDVARDFVDREYVGQLGLGSRAADILADVVGHDRTELRLEGRHARLAKGLAEVMRPKISAAERRFYRLHLVDGGAEPRSPTQPQLAALLSRLPRDRRYDRIRHRAVLRDSEREGARFAQLSAHLRTIEDVEGVIAPAGAAFPMLLARNGKSIASVAAELRTLWKDALDHSNVEAIDAVRSELSSALGDREIGARWVAIAGAARSGDYETWLRLLMEQNASVMRKRGSAAPWVVITNGKLDVRFRDETAEVVERAEVPDLWVSTYFIDALKSVNDALREPSDA